MIINETTERETLTRHYLCRVLDKEAYSQGIALPVWRVLCSDCRNKSETGFKRISFSEFPCDQCSAKWKPPPGPKAMKCKDRTVTITARYPDLENARNDIV